MGNYLVVRWLKRLGRLFPLRLQARLVALLIPRTRWFWVARWASRTQARVMGAGGGGARPRLTEAVMLDNWLRELTFSGPFPIPWKLVDGQALEHVAPGVPIVYCWTHLPLVELPLTAAAEMGYELPATVAEPGKIVGDNEFLVPGVRVRGGAIAVGTHVLTRMRNALREGRSVACLADAYLGGEISPFGMRMAGKAGARVIFQWAEHRPDGTIGIWYVDPPYPFCRTPEEIESNLDVLRAENRRILGELGLELPAAVEVRAPTA